MMRAAGMDPVHVAAEAAMTGELPDGAARALEAAPRGACATVLIHGYRFRPGDPRRDPFAQLYGGPAPDGAARCSDWTAALGAEGAEPVIGFGWDARAGHLSSWLSEGRNGFAQVYDRAKDAGEALQALLEAMRARRPDVTIDLFAHSLGARVALSAARAPGLGRLILMGAAEDAERAAAALPPLGRGPQVFHMAARHNDLFDAMFEAAAPRIEGRAPRALGRAGLGRARRDWIDLQLDAPELIAWLARRGVRLEPRTPPICHWSFYARAGAMVLYRRILRERTAWSIPALRTAGAPEGLSPRWSRLALRLPLQAPAPGAAGAGPAAA